jgi:hypothetical protein
MAYRSGLCFPNCPGDAIKAGLKRITADAFFAKWQRRAGYQSPVSNSAGRARACLLDGTAIVFLIASCCRSRAGVCNNRLYQCRIPLSDSFFGDCAHAAALSHVARGVVSPEVLDEVDPGMGAHRRRAAPEPSFEVAFMAFRQVLLL